MKIHLISNDASGSAGETDVAQVLADGGAEVETFEIADGADADESAPDRVVVAGGDGSVAVGALAACSAGVALAVVPCGTANDFAARMELPEEIEEAAKLAASGERTRKVDIADVGGRAFLNVASLGLAPAAAEAAENLKEKLGPLSYALGAVRAGVSEEPFACRVVCDGAKIFDGDAWQVTVGSTGAFGGGSQIDADADDGLLDVVVIEGGPRAGLARRAFGLRRGGVEEQAGVHDSRGAEIVVSVGPGHDLNIDGELVPAAELGHDGSEWGKLEFTVRARDLELVIPRKLLPDRVERASKELGSPRPVVPLSRRLAWPAAIAGALIARYATESLRHRRDGRIGYAVKDPAPPGSQDFRWAAEALTGHATLSGNKVDVLVNGDEIFPAVLEAVRAAKETLNIETYVYWQGEIANDLADAICERAEAGVKCRVLIDAIGSAKMDPKVITKMRDAGAEVVRFRPPKPHLLRRADNRSHRRVIVIDGRIGFTGGVGIAGEWEGNAEDPDHWRDTHFRVEGPIVHSLQGAFGEHWVEATGEALVGERFLPEIEPFEDGVTMQLVRSGAQVGDTNIEILFYLAIASAKKSIELTAAYFAPRPPFLEALCEAAKRGVKVDVLVPGPHIDKQFVRVAGRAVYEDLLDCGVGVHEYQPTMLHAKSMVVDGCWASVGTANFDNRSFQLNDELTLSVFDGDVAGRLSDVYARDLEQAEQIEPETWEQRSAAAKLREAITVPLRREL